MVQAESSFSYIRKKLILGSSLLARARSKPTSLELRGRLKIRRKNSQQGQILKQHPNRLGRQTRRSRRRRPAPRPAAPRWWSPASCCTSGRAGGGLGFDAPIRSPQNLFNEDVFFVGRGCVALLLPTQQPWVQIPAPWVFFSLLLSLWTELRLNQSSAKQWILQMQLAATSRAKHYKDSFLCKHFQ